MNRSHLAVVAAVVGIVAPFLFVVQTCSASSIVATEELLKVVLLSDVHYDPRYGTADAYSFGPQMCSESIAPIWGYSGCDAPLNLIASAINDTRTQNPDLLLMSGDWLRHGFQALPISDAIPAFQSVAALVATINTTETFAVPNFQGALGNNDFVPDYHFDLYTPSHPLLANQSRVLADLGLLSQNESQRFGKCGYYARDIRDKATNMASGLRVIVLNTVMYATYLNPPLSDNITDPCGQFQFLKDTLADSATNNYRVFIVGHIPPGGNLYNNQDGGMNASMQDRQFWQEPFVAQYRALLNLYASVVTFQFFGHTHMFSVLADVNIGVPGVIAPSVTQLFGNNPAYLVASVNRTTWQVVSVQLRFLNLTAGPSWQDGLVTNSLFSGGSAAAVSHVYNNVSVLAAGCTELIQSGVGNVDQWLQFQQVHEGGVIRNLFPTPPGSPPPAVPGTCNDVCKAMVLCSMLHVQWDEYSACVANGLPTSSPSPSSTTVAPSPSPSGSPASHTIDIVVGAVCGVGAVILVVLVVKNWKRVMRRSSADNAVLIQSSEDV